MGRTVTGPQDVPQGMGGYLGERRKKCDGVIADPATALDPTIKAGSPLVTPLPGPGLIDQLVMSGKDAVKDLVDYVTTSKGGNRNNDARLTNSGKVDSPVSQNCGMRGTASRRMAIAFMSGTTLATT